MTVVITGATGHVGANLVRALRAQHRPVRALVHVHREAIKGLEVDIAPGDVRHLESLVAAFTGADVVYHLAADISLLNDQRSGLEAVNITGTRNVVEACLRCGVHRLVHFSSIHAIIQEPMCTPVDESRPLVNSRRCPPYDRSKAAGEREVRRGIERGLDAVIISPTAIFGPYDYQPSHFGAALLAMANGRLPALVAGGFDWVDVRDVVAGAMQAEQRAPAGAKYMLSGHWLAIADLARMTAGITGIPAPSFICPLWLARTGAPFIATLDRLQGRRPLYTSASMRALYSNRDISHERATQELGYHPRPLRETLVDTLRWFHQSGQLKLPLKAASAEAAP